MTRDEIIKLYRWKYADKQQRLVYQGKAGVWHRFALAHLPEVIFKEGVLVHDPHPDNTGVAVVQTVDVLVPLSMQGPIYVG